MVQRAASAAAPGSPRPPRTAATRSPGGCSAGRRWHPLPELREVVVPAPVAPPRCLFCCSRHGRSRRSISRRRAGTGRSRRRGSPRGGLSCIGAAWGAAAAFRRGPRLPPPGHAVVRWGLWPPGGFSGIRGGSPGFFWGVLHGVCPLRNSRRIPADPRRARGCCCCCCCCGC